MLFLDTPFYCVWLFVLIVLSLEYLILCFSSVEGIWYFFVVLDVFTKSFVSCVCEEKVLLIPHTYIYTCMHILIITPKAFCSIVTNYFFMKLPYVFDCWILFHAIPFQRINFCDWELPYWMRLSFVHKYDISFNVSIIIILKSKLLLLLCWCPQEGHLIKLLILMSGNCVVKD